MAKTFYLSLVLPQKPLLPAAAKFVNTLGKFLENSMKNMYTDNRV